MSDEIEFTDRYQALGIPYPDPDTVCPGMCEGVGRYPVWKAEAEVARSALVNRAIRSPLTEYELAQWELEEKANPAADGTHFIVCGDCKGTGLRAGGQENR